MLYPVSYIDQWVAGSSLGPAGGLCTVLGGTIGRAGTSGATEGAGTMWANCLVTSAVTVETIVATKPGGRVKVSAIG